MSGIMSMLLGAASSAIKDAYFNLTTLLLNTSSTNGAQNNTFLDSSTNNFTITRNGNTTQGTFTPFSQTGWSNYFSATGDNLRTGTMTALSAGDFTVECWVYSTSFADYRLIWDNRTSDADANGFSFGINAAGKVIVYTNNLFAITTTNAVALNTWTHIALVRSGSSSGNVKIYINGTADVTTATNTANMSRTAAYIGNEWDGTGLPFVGYISNMRAATGALYSSTFTPSTTPLTTTVSAGTCVLLTCQSNRFLDNSASAVTITGTGASVQAFSPFLPTTAYDTSVVGGSGYFDGSGDSVVAASNAAFALGTGDFSIECWIYFVGTAAGGGTSGEFFGSTTNGAAVLRYKTGTLAMCKANTSDDISASVTLTVNQWYHICATRTGTTGSLYVNGIRVATNTSYTVSYGQGDMQVISGTNGYLSSSRLIKGSNPYGTGTTLTLPTAPVTAITNTSLLLNFTNAGIFDSAAKNVLETVGNAQVSTTQAKWGTTSISMDGTGDYLLGPSTQNVVFGTGDFTIEGWVYNNNTTNGRFVLYSTNSPGTSGSLAIFQESLSLIYVRIDGGNDLTATAPSTGAWNHIAVTRASGTLRIFINGTQGASATRAQSVTQSIPYIGDFPSAGYSLNGYLDDLRITKGYARYTATFTAPTAAFPLQ